MKEFLIWIAIIGFGIVIYSVIASERNGSSKDADNAGCLGICIIGFVILIGIIASAM